MMVEVGILGESKRLPRRGLECGLRRSYLQQGFLP